MFSAVHLFTMKLLGSPGAESVCASQGLGYLDRVYTYAYISEPADNSASSFPRDYT
jgi:hypothetical protein